MVGTAKWFVVSIKPRHRKLFNVLLSFSDKFDQFWAVNRKLMEASGDQDHFKYIPFRCYMDDGYKQKLIKPVTEDGRRKTLQEFLQELFPDNDNGKILIIDLKQRTRQNY